VFTHAYVGKGEATTHLPPQIRHPLPSLICLLSPNPSHFHFPIPLCPIHRLSLPPLPVISFHFSLSSSPSSLPYLSPHPFCTLPLLLSSLIFPFFCLPFFRIQLGGLQERWQLPVGFGAKPRPQMHLRDNLGSKRDCV